jgi:hypothetical protein
MRGSTLTITAWACIATYGFAIISISIMERCEVPSLACVGHGIADPSCDEN